MLSKPVRDPISQNKVDGLWGIASKVVLWLQHTWEHTYAHTCPYVDTYMFTHRKENKGKAEQRGAVAKTIPE